MAVDQLDLIKKQTEAVLRNRAAGSVAKLRSETSLVAQASRLTGRMTQALDQMEQDLKQPGAPASKRKPQAASPTAKPAPDGYVRRSPEQPIRVPADHRRRIVRKAVGGAIVVICAAGLIWLLLQTNLLAY